MLLRFTKMHGLGNDFMVVDGLTQSIRFSPKKIRQWSNRRKGIGFDQFLLVDAPTRPDADFRYVIYNADGSEASQCGNGARCFAKFVQDKKLSGKKVIRVQVADRVIEIRITNNGLVSVDMGEPVLLPKTIPFNCDVQSDNAQYILTFDDGMTVDVSVISMGNPHVVVYYPDIEDGEQFWESTAIEKLGEKIQNHPCFPKSCNVSFFEKVSRTEINLRVYERGAGETLACGSGACASMAAAYLSQQTEDNVSVNMLGGMLKINWEGKGHTLRMTGLATKVFEGNLRL